MTSKKFVLMYFNNFFLNVTKNIGGNPIPVDSQDPSFAKISDPINTGSEQKFKKIIQHTLF